MILRPPRSTRTDTPLPYTSLFRADPVRQSVEVPETGRITVNVALSGADGGDILVIGQAANQSSALSRQRAADGVSSVLTRDAIGQFPDQNVAESLRRLPGVNILTDQRSEERRVGKACVSPCTSQWSPYHYTKNPKPTINEKSQNN